MAALGEVPFGWYYGTVDATPLFVMLAKAYFARTGDLAFIEKIWPHIDRALHWINAYGDCDGDGFVEYSRQSKDGLVQQGWKDSNDSVFHADGTLATGPIALCEVQGYVYAAKRGAARSGGTAGKTGAGHRAGIRGCEFMHRSSTRHSGARISAPTRLHSMDESSRAAFVVQMPDIVSTPE